MTKEFNNLEEIQKYYNKKTNTYIFKENGEYIEFVIFHFNLDVDANIDAFTIIGRDITALTIEASDIIACDIKVKDIYADNEKINLNDVTTNNARTLINIEMHEKCCDKKTDGIMKMVENDRIANEYRQRKGGLTINLPVEKNKKFRMTLRLNDIVYEEFKEFADANKQFTVKELVSQALKEFVDKYK